MHEAVDPWNPSYVRMTFSSASKELMQFTHTQSSCESLRSTAFVSWEYLK